MSTKENKAMMRRWFEMEDFKGLPKSKMAETMKKVKQEIYAPGFVVHQAEGDIPLDTYLQASLARLNAFPDWDCKVEDLVAEGDKVVARMTVHGTHQGEYQGIPATGKKMAIDVVAIARVVGGKFAEGWGTYDRLAMMQQLGVIPKR
jgi:predicted ester cyclase